MGFRGQNTYQWASISVSVKLCGIGTEAFVLASINPVCISKYICPYVISGGKDCLTFILYRYELIISILLLFVPFFSLPTPTEAENEKLQYGCTGADRSRHSVAKAWVT